jgi:hypothetical protein
MIAIRVSFLTSSGRLRARDTVEADTPRTAAISLSRGARFIDPSSFLAATLQQEIAKSIRCTISLTPDYSFAKFVVQLRERSLS